MSECVTPYSNAGLFSIRSFSWMGSLIALGNKRTLDLEDVPRLDCSDSIYGVSPVLQNKLEAVVGVANRLTALRLAKVLFFSAWQEILFIAILALLYTLATYVGPYLIDNFVQYLNGRQAFEYEGYVLCLSERHWFFQVQQFGIRFRATLFAMIYNKGLTLSGQAKQGNTILDMHDPWMVLVHVAEALLILYKKLGLASIATLLATAIVMLANFPLGRLREKFQDKFMETKDRRIKATSEILRNMRILKLQGWELKKNETAWLKKSVYTEAMISFFCWGAPTFVSVVTFGSCILLGIPLESGMILSALTTFKILQEPIYYLPESISMMIQAKVPLDRIASFLCLEGLQTDVLEKMPRGNSDTAIEIIDGSFSWDFSSPNPTLRNINLKVFHGMRVAVCGTVGSGKSSCLSCILGGVPKESGIIRLCGTKAYVAQSPWIQSGKIEENILFGKEMDRERYERVLEACSLKKDLEVLPFGDQTIIGERGINLSGGQKQRIQIARPLYQDADIFLLDDPFSPVDDHTGAHLFKFCWVSSSKTVIYATHQVEFLPAADLILVIKDGKITQAGKYSDILNSGTDFMELVGAHKQALSGLDSIDRGPVSERKSINKENDGTSTTNEIVNKEENKNFQSDDEAALPKGQLVQEEEREKGKVGFSVYWKYMTTAYGGVLVPFILLAQIIFQIFQIGSNYWMAWATPVAKDVNPAVGASTLIIVYVGLAIGTIAGLAVTYGLNLNIFANKESIRNLERKIISVERILQCACIPSEPALVIEATKPNNSRPSHGEVNIRHLQVRYAPNLPLVLRGSGKSTLIQTLFRIVESTAGHILIDGKDISLIGLHDLRTRLSIIPQDPTMFEGTTRSNLDPLEEHADEQIWEALDKCQLGDEVRKKKGKLDSQGRVLLKKSKVLVLDEATASVDTATDNQIQQTLRQHFSDCTVVTIAHRITSVLDSAMEYDSPTKLLENKSSSFAQLVAEYTSSSS
ncbi:hypothetical protein CUMW_102080 [Citrus unshiu]|nr:hypothetical protein CUMW_102080 [Citrus unshiu]